MKLQSIAAILLATLSVTGCDGGTSPDPQENPPAVSLGDSVPGSIEHAETDVFSFTPASEGYVVVFLQALDSNVVQLRIDIPDSALTEAIVRASYAGDASLNANRTPLYPVGAGIKYRIKVNAPAGIDGDFVNGGYRFHIHSIDLDPEVGPATVALGTQISESFAGSGDYDRWTLTPAFADTLGLLFQFALQSPPANTALSVNLFGRSALNGISGYVGISPTDVSPYLSQLIAPSDLSTLELTVRMSDPPSYSFLEPMLPVYTFSTSWVDLRPEQRPTIGGLVDTLVTEAIDSVGDVDTYRITPAVTDEGYFIAMIADQASAGDTIDIGLNQIFNPGGSLQPMLRSTATDTALLDHVYGPFYRQASHFTVTVHASHLGLPSNQPTYRFGILVQDTLPETATAQLNQGDTVTSESIEYAGDVDVYTFSGTSGQVVTADVEFNSSFGGTGRLDIVGLGTVLPVAGAPLGTTPLTVTLPSTGTFRVKVFNHTAGRGPYRLILK